MACRMSACGALAPSPGLSTRGSGHRLAATAPWRVAASGSRRRPCGGTGSRVGGRDARLPAASLQPNEWRWQPRRTEASAAKPMAVTESLLPPNREASSSPAAEERRRRAPSAAALQGAALAALGLASTAGLQLASPAFHDTAATGLTLAGAASLVKLFDALVQRGLLEQKLSRKLVHITMGLVFTLFWPLYSAAPAARLCAVLVPAANAARLVALGNGALKDEATVRSISRDGNPSELLQGPLYYVLVLSLITVAFWRDSPVGLVALALMCAGDGIADIVGRRLGTAKLPWNRHKSWAGSLAMFFFGSAAALGIVRVFQQGGYFEAGGSGTGLRIAAIALAATIVESLPITDRLDDNLTVPLTSIALGVVLFPDAMPLLAGL